MIRPGILASTSAMMPPDGRNRPSTAANRTRKGGLRTSRRARTSVVAGLSVVTTSLFGPVPACALSCFSCADCSMGGALSAQKQRCPPEETFCAAVFRPRVGQMAYSSVDRGCASLLNVPCASDGSTTTPPPTVVGDRDREPASLGVSSHCCSTDLCNGSGDVRTQSYRRSEEHLRDLMEGNPRRGARVSSDILSGAKVGEEGTAAGDGNSAPSARGSGGSRFATVLVIVGAFSQVLWLAGSLMQ